MPRLPNERNVLRSSRPAGSFFFGDVRPLDPSQIGPLWGPQGNYFACFVTFFLGLKRFQKGLHWRQRVPG